MAEPKDWGRVGILAMALGCSRNHKGKAVPDPSKLLKRIDGAIAQPEFRDRLLSLLEEGFKPLQAEITKQPSRRGTHPNTIAALNWRQGRRPLYGQTKSGREAMLSVDALETLRALAVALDCLKIKKGIQSIPAEPNLSELIEKFGIAAKQADVKSRLIELLEKAFYGIQESTPSSRKVGRPLTYGAERKGREFQVTDNSWNAILQLATALGCVRKKEATPNASEFLQKLGMAMHQPCAKKNLIAILIPEFKRIEEEHFF